MRETTNNLVRVAAVPHTEQGTFALIREIAHAERTPQFVRHSDRLVRVAGVSSASVVVGEIPWSGGEAQQLYLQRGFTSTVLTSLGFSPARQPNAISWDGANTPYCYDVVDTSSNLVLQSGQFTSTVKDSQDVFPLRAITGISWDGADTPWSRLGDGESTLYLQSGQFTSTIKASVSVVAIDSVSGISFDGTDTPWSGQGNHTLYLQSGQFTSTVKQSLDVSSIDLLVQDISYDGADTPWCSNLGDKLYLQSGQFTSTIKNSLDVSAIDDDPLGINTNKRTTG